MAKFKFIKEENDFISTSTSTVEFSAVSLDEILKEFEYFLRGSGFHFDGTLDIVDENECDTSEWDQDVELDPILLQESDPWTSVVNRHEDELDQKYLNEAFGSSDDVCPVCKLSKEVMQSHKCWDNKCPINECKK